MNLMLAYFLYWTGDLISKLFVWDLFSFLYPVYTKIMIWSSDLDTDGRIWKNHEKD